MPLKGVRKINTEKIINKNIPVIFQNIEQFEKEDLRFVKVKLWLMHTGQNLNGSVFTKESVTKALPTLSNTPILAFIEENSEGELDYSDHRMVLHRKVDGDISVKYLGQAVGLIPETNNAKWEERITDSGEKLEYLTVEGLLWTKWDDPIDIIKRKGITSQSMELSDNYTGSWNKDGLFEFEEFQFFGACLLGKDVSPAMKNSTVEVQFTSDNDMQKIIENKLKEFNSLFSTEQGGNDKLEETKQEFETTEVETQVESTEETVVETTDVTDVTEEKPTEEFTEDTTTEQTEVTEDVEETKEESTETEVVEEFENVATEETQVEAVTETTEDVTDEVVEETTQEVNEFEVKFNKLSSQFETLQTELDELREFKRTSLETELSSKFEGQLTSEELAQVFEQSKSVSIEDIEKELFALVGKKNFSIQNEKPVTKIAVQVDKDTQKPKDPYNGFFEKYLDNK